MRSKISIKKNKRHILEIDDFKIVNNKINFLFGESGIGKSLISKSISNVFIEPILNIDLTSGTNQETLDELRRNGFYIFQEASSSLNQEMTIKEQLEEGDIEKVDLPKEILTTLFPSHSEKNYNHLIKRYPDAYQPSGGEKQRLLLLMFFKKYISFLNIKDDNALFVLDEAVANLDESLRNKVIDILLFLYKDKNSSIIFISHDYSIIEYIAERHSEQIENCFFTELERHSATMLVQKDFEIKDYLSWIKNIRKVPVKEEQELISINPNISIYNMNLILKNLRKSEKIKLYKENIYQIKAASGVGKTTFARILNGSIKADRFSMNLRNKTFDQSSSLAKWKHDIWGKEISMVFQQADEALNPEGTVYQTFKRLRIKKLNTKNKVFHFLKTYFDNIEPHFLNKKIRTLSGGQKQRINLLRTIAIDTKLIILDEPLTGLDFRTVQLILTLFSDLIDRGKTILLISHNESLFDRVIPEENIIHLENVC